MEKDLALARLQNKIPSIAPLTEFDMLIDVPRKNDTRLTVVSNYATNAPGGDVESLTIAECSIKDHFSNTGKLSNFIGTDCNTGEGSSGAQIYAYEEGAPKLLGIVQGEYKKKSIRLGSGYQTAALSTNVILFTRDLIDLYRTLPEAFTNFPETSGLQGGK